ncbi:hypothetical protein [Fibrobacter sp.]|uniref:hypothetical protein n=1 Tax=Fibrobacter sp. TaxID=35828 RepID=UPI003862EF93
MAGERSNLRAGLLQNKYELNSVTIENCAIGPNVTIGDNCKLKNLTMKDCIMWGNYRQLLGMVLRNSRK